LEIRKQNEQISSVNKVNKYDITEISKTVFDNDKTLAQSVMDITEKYKNHTIQDITEFENAVINNENAIDKEDLTNNSSEYESDEEEYDFSKKMVRKKENVEVRNLKEKKIVSFEEWKSEYFTNSGLNIQEMNEDMMMKIYENWKNKKLTSDTERVKEKKRKEKLNKNDIEDIKKATDRLIRSIYTYINILILNKNLVYYTY